MFAINGGVPVVEDHSMLIQKRPNISTKDMLDILKLFEEGKVSGRNSDIIATFEDKIKLYLGSRYAVAFNSGTAGLHAAVKSLGIEPGDEVIVPAFTFAASALAVLHNLSIPVFCDIDLKTYNISPSEIEKNITPKTKAIMVVHFQGLPADMPGISKIARKHGLKIIEDCAQSFGASIDNKYCGTFGDVGVFSMNPAKQLPSCGELGCLVSNDLGVINGANITKMYGEYVGTDRIRYYNSLTLGYNYLPNTIQAVFAGNKLDEFDATINNIISNAEALSEFIDENILFLEKPFIPEGYKHVFHMYRVSVNGASLGVNNNVLRTAIMDIMEKEGLKLRLYQNAPVPAQSVFNSFVGFGKGYPRTINEEKKDFYVDNYNLYKYPNTLKAISESFLIGGIGSAPLYFQNKDVIEKYKEGLMKLAKNTDELIEYCKKIESTYIDPREGIAKVSDTSGNFI